MTEQEPSTPAAQNTEEPATGTPGSEQHLEPKPEVKPSETVDFWKQKAREQESRAKANADAARELQAIRDSQKSEAQRQAEALAEAQKAASSAQQEALRWRIAAQHGITAEDAELFLTGSSEEAMNAQAQRLAEKVAVPKKPELRPDPSQGARGSGTADPAQQFAEILRRARPGG